MRFDESLPRTQMTDFSPATTPDFRDDCIGSSWIGGQGPWSHQTGRAAVGSTCRVLGSVSPVEGGEVPDRLAQWRRGFDSSAPAGEVSIEPFIACSEDVGIKPAEGGLAADSRIDVRGIMQCGYQRLIVVRKIAIHSVMDHIVLACTANDDWCPTR
jgi:hypothetical protein